MVVKIGRLIHELGTHFKTPMNLLHLHSTMQGLRSRTVLGGRLWAVINVVFAFEIITPNILTIPHPMVCTVYINPNMSNMRYAALSFSSPWCCDRHSGNGFLLPSFFLGPFFTEAEHMLPPAKRTRAPKGQNRPTCDRKPLQRRLHAWRNQAHQLDSLRAVRPPSFICDDKSIIKLSTMRPDKVTCPLDLVHALDETEDWQVEWAEQVFSVIREFDASGSNHDVDDELVGDEEEVSEEADGLNETQDDEEEEIVIPRKRARVSKIPSRVPVLVSVTNLSTQRKKRTK
jgi:hypothetical protein